MLFSYQSEKYDVEGWWDNDQKKARFWFPYDKTDPEQDHCEEWSRLEDSLCKRLINPSVVGALCMELVRNDDISTSFSKPVSSRLFSHPIAIVETEMRLSLPLLYLSEDSLSNEPVIRQSQVEGIERSQKVVENQLRFCGAVIADLYELPELVRR